MVTTLFGSEHDALREVVRRWVERDADAHAADWEKASTWPRETLTAIGTQGWLGTVAAESHGGDPIAAVAMWEELGRLRSAGVVHDLLAQAHASAILTEIDADAAIADPALVGTHAVTIIGGPFTATATDHPDHVTVSGQLKAVPNAAWADAAIIALGRPDGAQMVYVPANGSGWSAPKVSQPYGRRAGQVGDLTLDDAKATVLARGDAVMAVMGSQHTRWRLNHAAATVAAAWRTWEDAKEYALQREAFGRPIATFQVNRHALADMAADLTAARSLVHDTLHRYVNGTLTEGDTAAMRLYVDRVTLAAANRCLQLHGGFGYTMAYDVQRAWRDAAHLRNDEGGHERLSHELVDALESAHG